MIGDVVVGLFDCLVIQLVNGVGLFGNWNEYGWVDVVVIEIVQLYQGFVVDQFVCLGVDERLVDYGNKFVCDGQFEKFCEVFV